MSSALVPVGVGDAPPGSAPAAALDDAPGAESVRALRGVFRERNRVTARLLRAMHAAGRAVAEGTTRGSLDEFSGDEVAVALGWSRSMAGRWLELAHDLVTRLPGVLVLMEEGSLDDGKARIFSEWTRDLCDDHAAAVASGLLPRAAGLCNGALIEAVQQSAIALDPQWAARREARARRRARVAGSMTPAGTATLAGYDLPVDEAVEALARVEAVAAAVRARGVRDVPVARLRAIVYLRLLDGTCAGLDDDTLTELLVRSLRDDPDGNGLNGDGGPDGDGPDGPGGPGPHDPPGPGPDDPSGPNGVPSDADPAGPDPAGDEPVGEGLPAEPDDRADTFDGQDDGLEDADGTDGPGAPGDETETPTEDGAAEEDEDGAEAEDSGEDSAVPPPTRGLRRGTRELRLRLSTALGLDDLPAHAPGWGPVLAGTARHMLTQLRHGEWRLVITDDHGHLRHVLLTRHRPTGPRPTRRGTTSSTRRRDTRAVVELAVPASLLAALDPVDHPGWARLLTDTRDRLAQLPPDGDPDRTPTAHTHAERRRAHTELDRWVRVRDRCCAFPGCRRPARACDLDHTRAWAHHGPSAAWNLGTLCRHHHRAKHHGNWHLHQPAPGRFRWRSRAGVTYTVAARRVLEPLPDPVPRPNGRRRPLPPEPTIPTTASGLRPVPDGPRTTDPGDPTGPRRSRTPTRPVTVTVTDLDDDPPPF